MFYEIKYLKSLWMTDRNRKSFNTYGVVETNWMTNNKIKQNLIDFILIFAFLTKTFLKQNQMNENLK